MKSFFREAARKLRQVRARAQRVGEAESARPSQKRRMLVQLGRLAVFSSEGR